MFVSPVSDYNWWLEMVVSDRQHKAVGIILLPMEYYPDIDRVVHQRNEETLWRTAQ